MKNVFSSLSVAVVCSVGIGLGDMVGDLTGGSAFLGVVSSVGGKAG